MKRKIETVSNPPETHKNQDELSPYTGSSGETIHTVLVHLTRPSGPVDAESLLVDGGIAHLCDKVTHERVIEDLYDVLDTSDGFVDGQYYATVHIGEETGDVYRIQVLEDMYDEDEYAL